MSSSPESDLPSFSTPIRVVSGIRATGRLHLGNYLGALRTFAALSQRDGTESYFFVADLHTLSSLRDPATLRAMVPEIVLDCLAAGIDPDRAAMFVQSSVPATSELAWLLSSVTYVGELERVPNFKERERHPIDGEPINAALLNYPLLMAADILGPRAHRVPVGEDQYPHLELARDIVRRFHRKFFVGRAPFFPEPVPADAEPVRVPGLDGTGKMGKSHGEALNLHDTAEERWAKLAPAVTDPARRTRTDPGTPEHCGIFAMHQLVSRTAVVAQVADGCRTAGIGCVDCKRALNEALDEVLVPLQARRAELAARPGLVSEVLAAGARRARATVGATRDEVQDCVGIVRYGA